jgi:UDPglucose 6-dehydrogenase
MCASSAQATLVCYLTTMSDGTYADVAPGTPTAAVLALQNPALKVDVLDRDQERVRRWQSAHLPIHEPGLDEVVRAARDGAQLTLDTEGKAKQQHSRHKPNLFFTTNSKQALSDADMIFLAVNTPTKTFGQGAGRATHMSAVDGAVKDIAKYAKSGVIIVEKSTVPCGTAKRIQQAVSWLFCSNCMYLTV